jgi:hypothetical protein
MSKDLAGSKSALDLGEELCAKDWTELPHGQEELSRGGDPP